MKLSFNWLSEFIEFTETDHNVIKEVITANSAEVETMENTGELLQHIVLAEIVKLEPHPEADKLQLATVNEGSGSIRVVCGGSNLKVGMKIAFAKVGTVVKLGGQEFLELKPIKIRGVESTGMICASTEIGLEEKFPLKQEKEVLDLSHLSAPLGTTLDRALGMNDTVIDIDNHAITNRSDLFSQLGFARELVSNGLAQWKKSRKQFEIPKENAEPPIQVHINEPELCPRYSAIYLTGIEVKESSDTIKERLSACGIRPINNIVDVTNYVMLELGMPLHAFDFDQLAGKKWEIRRSKKGETVVTLDQKKHQLPSDVIVIDDGQDLVDLCGIMGGYQSGINNKTNKIWLHAPIFNKQLVRQAGRTLNHTSDASTRYEKGVDAELTTKGLARAVELILESCPGAKVASKEVDIVSIPTEQRVLSLRQARLDHLIGVTIPKAKIVSTLENLGFGITENKEDLMSKFPVIACKTSI
ncbi:phenylalanine--tRNA ligase subunit beta [Candidatus Peregrinibacteria bacterium]|nr:MAG: phenylalanine--tRNA ligase subunit beta [Candidatus Peregrinibacteria bacterium]